MGINWSVQTTLIEPAGTHKWPSLVGMHELDKWGQQNPVVAPCELVQGENHGEMHSSFLIWRHYRNCENETDGCCFYDKSFIEVNAFYFY